MYTYKLGGIPITDELYHDDLEAMTFGRKGQNELWHHGILGQKWGIRRYQNPDGTLTTAGKERYGNRLGPYAQDIATSGFRRAVTGDSFGGMNKIRGRKEEKLKEQIKAAEQSGNFQKSKKLKAKYEAMKEGNIARDIFYSKMSNGEIVAKRLLLRDGTNLMPRTDEELARFFNTPEITEKVKNILNYAGASEEARLAILMYAPRK